MSREMRKIFGEQAVEITEEEWEQIQRKGKGIYHIFIEDKHWIPLCRMEEYLS